MALEEVTLAEALKPAGYRTALRQVAPGAHRDYGPKKQGFDEFLAFAMVHRQLQPLLSAWHRVPRFVRGHHAGEGARTCFPELMVKRALKFIDENRSVRFLYVPFNIPHYPEQALRDTRRCKG